MFNNPYCCYKCYYLICSDYYGGSKASLGVSKYGISIFLYSLYMRMILIWMHLLNLVDLVMYLSTCST